MPCWVCLYVHPRQNAVDTRSLSPRKHTYRLNAAGPTALFESCAARHRVIEQRILDSDITGFYYVSTGGVRTSPRVHYLEAECSKPEVLPQHPSATRS